VDNADRVYIRNGVTSANPVGTGWAQVPGALAQVSVGDGEVWGVTDDDRIYRRNGISEGTPQGTSWERMPGYLASISCGPAGVVGLTSWGGIFTWTGSGWDRIPGYLSQVSVGQDGMWGITSWGGIFYRPSVADDGTPWERKPGYLANISCGPDDEAWGITSWGGIFHWNGTAWSRVSGHLAQIDGSTNCAWGVNQAGAVFRRMGVCPGDPNGTGWEAATGGTRVQVAVGLEAGIVSLAEAANAAPVAEAGPDICVVPGQQFTLSGLGSTDEDGEIVLYEWDMDGDGTFETKGTEPDCTLWEEGIYQMTLRVTDAAGATDTDTCTVLVTSSE
jgi:hypothetical protein